jgi:hypothetical protein
VTEPTAGPRKPGRPRGTGAVARLRDQLLTGDQLDALVSKVYALAIEGDTAAIRILLDRLVPPLRSQAATVKLKLPDGSLTEQARALLKAATDGRLPADLAAELISSIAKVAGVDQVDELRRQVEALEQSAHRDLA